MTKMAHLDMSSIPIIDFSRFATDFDCVAEEIKNVSATWGFLYLQNHDMDQSLINRIFEISDAFFNKTPQAEKNSCPYDSINNAGYDNKTLRTTYFQEYGAQEQVSTAHPKEDFTLRKELSYNQPLPPSLQASKHDIQHFMREAHEKIAVRVLACISAALGLSKNSLPDLHQFEKPAMSTLRLIHYPACATGDESPMRLPSHADHGVITVLFQHQVMGLQVRPPKYTGHVKEGEVWIDAPVIPGTILINIGETMTFFSGSRMKVLFTVLQDRLD
jgi:isopenicillin N synthase-like dioxygenase